MNYTEVVKNLICPCIDWICTCTQWNEWERERMKWSKADRHERNGRKREWAKGREQPGTERLRMCNEVIGEQPGTERLRMCNEVIESHREVDWENGMKQPKECSELDDRRERNGTAERVKRLDDRGLCEWPIEVVKWMTGWLRERNEWPIEWVKRTESVLSVQLA